VSPACSFRVSGFAYASPHFLFSKPKGSSPRSQGREDGALWILASSSVKTGRTPLTKHGHLVSAYKVLCGAAQWKGGGTLHSYLSGLSLNSVLWLPVTELPPLLLLPSSSPCE
jgi:hypothetical protein